MLSSGFNILSTILINRYTSPEIPLKEGKERIIDVTGDVGLPCKVLEVHPENKKQFNIIYNVDDDLGLS